MRVQTYTNWVHRHEPPRAAEITQSPIDALTGIINDLIAQVTYYPSYVVQISPDAQGLLIAGAQRVLQTEEQPDGMVVLRTHARNIWITHAAYHRLLA